MPVPVFDEPIEKKQEKEQLAPEKQKVSGWVIFFSILLISALVTMGEFAFKDTNRLVNPYYDACYEKSNVTFPYFSQQGPINEACDIEKYERVRLILHADVAVPLILLSILIYLLIRGKKLSSQRKVLYYSYLIFILWIVIRLVSETEYYLLKHFSVYGKYLVFLSVVIIFTYLIISVQKKFSKKIIE